MSTPQDPEQLLAQALRAQAARAPQDERTGSSGEYGVEPAALAAEPGEVPTPPAWPGETAPAESAPTESARPESAEPGYPRADVASGIAPGTPSGYGLLSGTGASSLEAERAALEHTSPAPREPASAGVRARRGFDEAPTTGPLPARWVLLLAVLLGLAAGSVVGMLTLL